MIQEPPQREQPRREFSLRWLLWAYAILATLPLPAEWSGFGLEEGGSQLVVVSEAPILAMTVTYAGREAQPWPRTAFPRDRPRSLLFPHLRDGGGRSSELTVRWRTAQGERTLTTSMVLAGQQRECLLLLRLDGEGAPAGPSPGAGIDSRCASG